MITTQTSRRAFIGSAGIAAMIAVAPIAASATVTNGTADWTRLRARFNTLRGIENDLLAEQSRREDQWYAVKQDTREPERPSARFDTSMTLAELRDACDEPAYLAAWADYERDHAAWKAQHEAQRAEIMGDSEKAVQQAQRITNEALAALRDFPVPTYLLLEEKIDLLAKHFSGELDDRDAAAIAADIRRLNKEAQA